MDKPSFVYVTYIASTPEKLWEALTSASFTERYMFGRRVESDWRVGSPVHYYGTEGELTDSGEVLEADRPRRLSYTWRVELHETLSREGHSRVTFDLEPAGSEVKLTVVHDGFPEGSQVLPALSGGWPKALSSLKTLLETGRALSVTSREAGRPAEEATIRRAVEAGL
jgi:uncharacterized protein YndB with AHSA1/START domain